ncbi:MAG: PQQ-dependent sugar dehydrogenase, partial [Phycisphaerae bacterium]
MQANLCRRASANPPRLAKWLTLCGFGCALALGSARCATNPSGGPGGGSEGVADDPSDGVEGGSGADGVPEPVTQVALRLVADGLTSPTGLTDAGDGSGRLFVLDQVGQVRIIDAGGTLLAEPFLDVSDRMVSPMPDFDERGLLGIAFHSDYAANGRFFIYYSAPADAQTPQDFDSQSRV